LGSGWFGVKRPALQREPTIRGAAIEWHRLVETHLRPTSFFDRSANHRNDLRKFSVAVDNVLVTCMRVDQVGFRVFCVLERPPTSTQVTNAQPTLEERPPKDRQGGVRRLAIRQLVAQ